MLDGGFEGEGDGGYGAVAFDSGACSFQGNLQRHVCTILGFCGAFLTFFGVRLWHFSCGWWIIKKFYVFLW